MKDFIIAVICKNESKYLKEFIDYHLQIGFDKFIIADNNDLNGERYEELLKDYISKEQVIILDYRGKKEAQKPFYNKIINDKPFSYEWCAFIDVDEFITFNDKSSFYNIKDFLNQNPNIKAYCLNWMIFGDNGLVTYEDKPCTQRFTTPSFYNLKRGYSFPENCHIKSILHYDVTGTFSCVHNINEQDNLIYYNGNGEKVTTSPFQNLCYDTIFIRHFYTKTIEEWIDKKYNQVRADFNPKIGINYPLEDFFIYNDISQEKINLIQSKGLTVPKNLNVDIFIYSHVKFTPKVKNKVYKVLTNNKSLIDLDFNTSLQVYFDYIGDNISDNNLLFNEYSGFYWILHNWKLKDYIGMIHYRRYYNFLDDIPDINKLFGFGFKIILNKAFPLIYNNEEKTNREFYEIWHNVEDFDLMGEIVKTNYPQYADGWEIMSNAKHIYPSSMFIMPTELFKEYITFALDVMNKFNDARNCHTKDEWIDYVKKNENKYIRKEHPYYDVIMQSRVIGYLVERCLAAFLMSGGENSLEKKSCQFDWQLIDNWK